MYSCIHTYVLMYIHRFKVCLIVYAHMCNIYKINRHVATYKISNICICIIRGHYTYCIHSTFGRDINLAIW